MQSNQVTELLMDWQNGERSALDQLIPILYSRLKNIAGFHLSKERKNHTLQPTALVNEAFEKLIGVDVSWKNRAHFFGVCSRIMRHILVDYARSKAASKRDAPGVVLNVDDIDIEGEYFDVLLVDEIMTRLNEVDEGKCKLAELYYFGGLSQQESAEVLGISLRTVGRELKFTKAWILAELAQK